MCVCVVYFRSKIEIFFIIPKSSIFRGLKKKNIVKYHVYSIYIQYGIVVSDCIGVVVCLYGHLGSVRTKLLMAVFAFDSVGAFVTCSGAEFHSRTLG